MPDELSVAIERLYDVFADVPKPKRIDACPCCCDNKQLDAILLTSRRNLTTPLLSSYAFSAFNTVGDISDYAYYFPRILELSAIDEEWWIDLELTAGKAATNLLPTWTNEQKTAVEQLHTASISRQITNRSYDALDDWLCAMAIFEFNIAGSLRIVEGDPNAILDLFQLHAESFCRNRELSGPYWRSSTGRAELIRWFQSPLVRATIHDAYGCSF